MYWTFCWIFLSQFCHLCVCFVRFTTRSFASLLMLLWRRKFRPISFLICSIFVWLWFFLPAPSQVWEQVGENTKPKITNHFQKSEKIETHEKRTTNSILNHQLFKCVWVSVCVWYILKFHVFFSLELKEDQYLVVDDKMGDLF